MLCVFSGIGQVPVCSWIRPEVGLSLAWAGPELVLSWAWAGPELGLSWSWAGPELGLSWSWAGSKLVLSWAWAGPELCLGWAWAGSELGLSWVWAGPELGLSWAWAGSELVLSWAWAGHGIWRGPRGFRAPAIGLPTLLYKYGWGGGGGRGDCTLGFNGIDIFFINSVCFIWLWNFELSACLMEPFSLIKNSTIVQPLTRFEKSEILHTFRKVQNLYSTYILYQTKYFTRNTLRVL